jgi:hypothetical protein
MITLNAKIENAIAPVIKLVQQRDDQIETAIIEWASKNIGPTQANELIDIVRKLQSPPDFRNDLTTLAANLTSLKEPE